MKHLLDSFWRAVAYCLHPKVIGLSLLPLLIGVLSILGTFLALHLTVQVTDVSIYSVNLATSLGLGPGLDYSPFMVPSYRA